MLIIPAENAVNWKRPPWVTLGLIMACLLVFLFYQGGDDRKFEAALEDYLESDLLALEAPAYEDYLQREIQFEGSQQRVLELQEFQQLQENEEELWQAVTLLLDREFYQYLQQNRDLIWAPAQRNLWLEQRSAIEQQWISRMSAYQLGLVPAELSLYTLITYQFLHGGWGHIIGNLLFLFLLGFTVEKALGPGRFLVAYLVCGALSGLVFTAFSMGSQVPLVGASGSISGLMGMYVAIYGLQRIRFFYFLGVYFNYFRAPAIAMLPVWLGKEIYDYWFAGATGIAYMAHAGGLAAGAGLVWLLGQSWLQVKEEFFEPEQEEQDEQFTKAYGQAMASLGRMEFDLARRQFEALRERYPERPVLLEHLYQLAKLRPDLDSYRMRAEERMADAIARRQPEQMVDVWQEYLSKGEAYHPLAPEAHNRVLFASLKRHDFKAAEKAFERMRAKAEPDMVNEACRLLVAEFEKLQMEPKARHYRQLLQVHG
ncbi:rhomboid family intramembrane serine protease [Marinobacter nauticus]|uniref:Membrane associated rhomboid family serine protease n=1 Tax=Marinobacter nauticus TaxID=2743 RepID=A0A368V993_MARNT|nr:rhomboid family intramembrane serine protease [Marinobacter nauticus]RBP76017.1 membrane associated rhomboid family serine protease [Marinobacter nauticus]RCW36890.1 membrane associated rhomboid family serine protease [Marinobacter nauticus]